MVFLVGYTSVTQVTDFLGKFIAVAGAVCALRFTMLLIDALQEGSSFLPTLRKLKNLILATVICVLISYIISSISLYF